GSLAALDRDDSAVTEAVDVRVREGVDHHSVVARELPKAPRDRLGVHLRPVARGRAWKVDGVDSPGPGPGWVEAKLGGRLDRAQESPLSGRASAVAVVPSAASQMEPGAAGAISRSSRGRGRARQRVQLSGRAGRC